jgi:N-methylhydantoinase B
MTAGAGIVDELYADVLRRYPQLLDVEHATVA